VKPLPHTLAWAARAGTGGELWRAPSRRGKNAPPAADRWPTFIFPASGDTVAVWRACAAFLSPSLIAPPRGPAVVTTGAGGPRSGMPRRPAGPAAPAPAPLGAKLEIGWSETSAASSVLASSLWRVTTGNLSRVTDVAARQPLLAARRRGTSGSRFPACSAGADRYGRRAWPSTYRGAPIRYVGSWSANVNAFLSTLLVVATVSCAPSSAPKIVDRGSLRAVVLPDLSRLEESVQAQLRERYDALTAKQQDPRAPAADLGNEYGEMGRLLMAAEFRDPAEASLLNAAALEPGDMRWPYYLGHLYREKGDISNATDAFQQALRSAPDDVPTMIWLAEVALDQGRTDVAEPLFAKALSVQPRSATAHYGLGRASLARKDYARAVQHLEQALAVDSKASVIHYSLAMAYRGMGDQRQAESHLRQRGTLQIRPDPLRKELDELLHSALTYEKNADTAGARGEWAEAAEYLRKAIVLAPTRAAPHHKLGTAMFYLGDRGGAIAQFHEALRLSPDFAQAHYALGVIHEDAGEHQRAIESFSAALKSDPGYADARLGLANALRRSGQADRLP